ncbi:TMEM175 family protein [Streptomyces sp. NPDC050738]|uniref:TMEM175 family protein n=1 Tax=Streptomyces sp. NPDC050738 TaxID=3154744 RepID=UPI00341992F7
MGEMSEDTAAEPGGAAAELGSPERLVALSDGVYAIAITLLVLDIKLPPDLDKAEFEAALRGVWPSLGAYGLSFAVLAGYWRDQRRIVQQVRCCDTLMIRVALAGLGLVALLPFPTSVLSEYGGSFPEAVALYAATIAGIALLHLALFLLAWRRPHLMAAPLSDRAGWDTVIELASIVPVAVVSVAVAFAVSTSAALWTWLAAIPLKYLLRRLASGRGRI